MDKTDKNTIEEFDGTDTQMTFSQTTSEFAGIIEVNHVKVGD